MDIWRWEFEALKVLSEGSFLHEKAFDELGTKMRNQRERIFYIEEVS